MVETAIDVRVVDPERAARELALGIARDVGAAREAGRPFAVGLAAGRSPLGLYREWIRLHRAGRLDCSSVVAFSLDEYLDLGPDAGKGLGAWLRAHLLEALDLKPENVHAPPTDLRRGEVDAFARDYERRIAAAGGLDLAILGIGRNGHIAFNEPPSARDSRTRAVELDEVTREDCAAAFGGLERVPRRAVTLGIADILAARSILVLAFGESKRASVRAMLHGEVGPQLPASFLREHPGVRVFVDRLAMGAD